MASILKRIACAAAGLMLAGLAEAQSVGDRVDIGAGVRLDALPAQKMTPGRCALFLWSKSERPVFILFATESPAEALVRIGGRNQQLARKGSSGERILGHFENQTFAAGKYSFQVNLTYDRTKIMQDGAVIDHGVLKTLDKNGHETIVPVGGMIGCQKA
jgi:hypothetical protein